ncbi:MAG: class I SAM-dependent methyltransferase [Flavobacteriales bacterium]|nr:class I SAM-dependent methyltransferase [Flavobacteriales bacterium]
MSRAERKQFIDIPFNADTQDLYHVRTSIQRALTAVLPKLQGTFLDVGCGVQPYRPMIMAAPSRVQQYLGMDFKVDDDSKYSTAKPDLFWDGVTIPLADTSVDCAMATEVLEHCPDPLAVLRELYRVIRPGGHVLITVPFLWPLHDAPYDEHRYTPFALQRLLAGAGFSEVEVKAAGGWDASLGQMIGLWVMRRPLPLRLRAVLKYMTAPVVRYLIKRDKVPEDLDWLMITALSAVARKPL